MTEDQQDFSLVQCKEILPTTAENRVLVLGSRVSGVFELGKAFQEYLKQRDISEPSVEVLRDAGRIKEAILGGEMLEESGNNPNLPKGIILLPEMRQYSPSGMGMSLDTYTSGISVLVEELCREWGIPLVEIKEYKTPSQIEKGIKKLLEPKTEE